MAYKNKEDNNNYQRNWRKNNLDRSKEIQKKSEEREERKEYRRKWWKESPKAKLIKERFKANHKNIQREYDKKFKENNPERVRKKYEKYYSSIKGIINRLKKADSKRFNISNNKLTIDLITSLDNKYIFCWYCGKEFKPRFDYDHINPFKPFSENNIIKVCSKCNQSKNNADLIDWMKFKNYAISDELINLYNKSKL